MSTSEIPKASLSKEDLVGEIHAEMNLNRNPLAAVSLMSRAAERIASLTARCRELEVSLDQFMRRVTIDAIFHDAVKEAVEKRDADIAADLEARSAALSQGAKP